MKRSSSCSGERSQRTIEFSLDEFAWEALDAECKRLEVAVEELAAFSVLYYLADLNSGRIARAITRSPLLDDEQASSPDPRRAP